MKTEPLSRQNKITSIVLGVFLCVSGLGVAIVSLTGVLPAGKSNSPVTWITVAVLIVLGAVWLVIGLKSPVKR